MDNHKNAGREGQAREQREDQQHDEPGHEHGHGTYHAGHQPEHGPAHTTGSGPGQEEQGSCGSILTVRAVSGLSGDMVLSGLAALAGVNDTELDEFIGELKVPALNGCLRVTPRFVKHIAGVGCEISLPHEHAHRTLADIAGIITDAAMPEDAKNLSLKAFSLLAEAEAAVHGTAVDQVTFHEVGALDSILDICLVCRLFVRIRPSRFICSPLPLADGAIFCAHGCIPSPAPAVLRLLAGVPVTAFAGHGESVTPTAIALLKALGAEFGGWPSMKVATTVISYGSRVFENAPNGAIWALGSAWH